MKKSIVFFSLILTLVLMCGLILTNSSFTNKNVYAKGIENEHIIVVGKGEVQADPDMVRVSFTLKCRAESLQAGQIKMRETIKSVTDKITEYNKDAEVYTNYSSSYPVFEGGLLAYEFDSCLIAKSPDVEGINGLVDAIVDAGATSVHSVNYMLNNKDEAYILALKQAKQNAEEKAKAIYENVTLKGLKEETVYNYCEGTHNEKIKISAKVTAFYNVNSINNIQNEITKNASSQNAFNEKSTNIASTQAKVESENNSISTANENINIVKNNVATNNKKQIKLENSENVNKELSINKEVNATSELNGKETGSGVETSGNVEIMNNKETSSEEFKQTNSEIEKSVQTNNRITKNKTANRRKLKAEENTIKDSSTETTKANEPLSIIDANGNVVLEII